MSYRLDFFGEAMASRSSVSAIRLIGLLMSTIVHASFAQGSRHICWLDGVTQEGRGVALHFGTAAGLSVRVRHLDEMTYFSVLDGKASKLSDVDLGLTSVSAIVLNPGDVAYLDQSPEDTCKVVMDSRGGHIGVLLQAHFNPPGVPPNTASEFVGVQ